MLNPGEAMGRLDTMRIAIIAPGSRGDVQSYLALGTTPNNAGPPVRFVTHQYTEALVTSHAFEFWPVEGTVQAIVQGIEMRERIEKGSYLRLIFQMAKEAKQGAIH
jgi:UDP:flavonoid glycosyltransferase YjiC (YdhE family)